MGGMKMYDGPYVLVECGATVTEGVDVQLLRYLRTLCIEHQNELLRRQTWQFYDTETDCTISGVTRLDEKTGKYMIIISDVLEGYWPDQFDDQEALC